MVVIVLDSGRRRRAPRVAPFNETADGGLSPLLKRCTEDLPEERRLRYRFSSVVLLGADLFLAYPSVGHRAE